MEAALVDLTPQSLIALEQFIVVMNQTNVMPWKDALRLANRTAGAGSPSLRFLARPDAPAYLKSIRYDLGAQVRICRGVFDDYHKLGAYPAPAYARRVGIILRKARMKDRSNAFQVAWWRHFPNGNPVGWG